MQSRRVLICGPVAHPGQVGGLRLALEDLAAVLESRGWSVDLAITATELGLPQSDEQYIHLSGLTRVRWAPLPRFRFLPGKLRTLLLHILLDGGYARVQSDVMRAVETRLHERSYDAVIACPPKQAPGLAHFLTEVHPNVLLLSLDGLPSELRWRNWLAWPRAIARVFGRRWMHRSLYRPVDPERVRMAIFASERWRREAIDAGFPERLARTIYFGLPDIPALTPPASPRNRLLWVGRLSREKGLHHFIEALPLIRRTRPVVLTAVCGQGPDDYRRGILRQIEQSGLTDVVRLLPPVPRRELAEIYRAHDALVFHSVFSEPVALVVAEAFAAGLPVITLAPQASSALLRPDETCLCFSPMEPLAFAAAVDRMLVDHSFRERLREQAHALIRRHFHLEVMGAAYDDALRTLLANRDA